VLFGKVDLKKNKKQKKQKKRLWEHQSNDRLSIKGKGAIGEQAFHLCFQDLSIEFGLSQFLFDNAQLLFDSAQLLFESSDV